jgi:hemerythrin-like metal-binding protein
MTALAWTPDFVLHHAAMDRTHEEFVALLGAAEAAAALDEATLLARWEALVEHTVAHFAQEDRWMATTGFAPLNCHSAHHHAVLMVMRECARRAREEGEFEPLRVAIGELAIWFPQHAEQMDAALAQHLNSVGFDPATERVSAPLTGEPITGCGGNHCG